MQVIPETCHVDYNICILKSLVVPYAGYARNVPCGLQHMYSEIFGRTLCRLFQKHAMWTTTYVFWNLWSYLMQAMPETWHVDYNICILKSCDFKYKLGYLIYASVTYYCPFWLWWSLSYFLKKGHKLLNRFQMILPYLLLLK